METTREDLDDLAAELGVPPRRQAKAPPVPFENRLPAGAGLPAAIPDGFGWAAPVEDAELEDVSQESLEATMDYLLGGTPPALAEAIAEMTPRQRRCLARVQAGRTPGQRAVMALASAIQTGNFVLAEYRPGNAVLDAALQCVLAQACGKPKTRLQRAWRALGVPETILQTRAGAAVAAPETDAGAAEVTACFSGGEAPPGE